MSREPTTRAMAMRCRSPTVAYRSINTTHIAHHTHTTTHAHGVARAALAHTARHGNGRESLRGSRDGTRRPRRSDRQPNPTRHAHAHTPPPRPRAHSPRARPRLAGSQRTYVATRALASLIDRARAAPTPATPSSRGSSSTHV